MIPLHSIVDLTQTLTNKSHVYPGDPPIHIQEVAHHQTDGFAVAKLELNDHAGTHVETQYHMLTPGRYLVDEPPDRFIGRACILPVQSPLITSQELLPFRDIVRRNPFTLLRTGYSSRTSQVDPDDPNRPIVSQDALEWLCEQGMRLLGIDAFDFDVGPTYRGHHYLFKRNVLVVEGLINLQDIPKQEITLLVLPLKIAATGASPCRVLALLD